MLKNSARLRILRVSLISVGILVGIFLLLLGSQPFLRMQEFLQHFSTTGRADSFTPSAWAKVAMALEGVAAVFIIFAMATIFRGEVILSRIEKSFSELSLHGRELQTDFRAFLDKNRADLPWLLLITALGACFRIKFLFSPMRYDETFTFYYFAKRPFVSILTDYMLPNNHVLYTMMIRCFYLLFGSVEWALRAPSFIFGVLLIPATWLFASIFYGPRVALWSAALVSASSYLIEFSSNSRGNTLIALFGLLIFCLAAYVRKKNNRAAWSLIVLMSALGFFTMTTLVFEVAGIYLWLFFSFLSDDVGYPRRPFLFQAVKAGMATVLLTVAFYLPIMIFTGVGSLVSSTRIPPMAFQALMPEVLKFFRECWLTWNRAFPLPLQLILSGGVLLTIFSHRKITREANQAKNSPIASVILAGFAVLLAMRHTIFQRFWLYMIPFYLVGGLGWLALLPKWAENKMLTRCLAAFLAIGLAYPIYSRSAVDFGRPGDSETLQDGKEIAQELKRLSRPEDQIFSPFPFDIMMAYYLERAGLPNIVAGEPSSQRIFLVHNLLGEGFAETLGKAGTNPWSRYTAPVLLKSYAHTNLYEVHLKTL